MILIGVDCPETNILYNYLSAHVSIDSVVIEDKISKKKLIRNRLRKIGQLKVIGQLLFQVFIQKLLLRSSKNRIAEILSMNHLSQATIPDAKILRVSSVNDKDCIDLLNKLNPSIIVVNGTRIISKKVLDSVHAKFVNMHMGITPKYRGVHGAYWAMANKDPQLCGVTIHLIDEGIDTGSVLKQALISTGPHDNFATYPYLQLAKGLPLFLESLQEIEQHNSKTIPPLTNESSLWYHPTIFEYFYNRFFNKVS